MLKTACRDWSVTGCCLWRGTKTNRGESCREEDHSHEGHGFHRFAVGFGRAADVEHDFAVALSNSVVSLYTVSLKLGTVYSVVVPVKLETLQV